MTIGVRLALLGLTALLAACAGEENGGEVLASHRDALQAAEDVSRLIEDTDAARRRTIDQQGQ